jgi:hypothetical protein
MRKIINSTYITLDGAVEDPHLRALASFYCRDARTRGIANAKAGSVVAIQRFDSALRLNVHFHSLWPDGTFTCAPRQPEAAFHPARPITNEDVGRLVRQIRGRVLRYLRKTGKLNDLDAAELGAHEASLFDTLRAAAIVGKTALGPRAGRNDPRIDQGSAAPSDFTHGKLCANLDGFSLHAAVRVDGCNRDRLERLCRYALRPPIVHERLALTSDGSKVLCKFKRRWCDGSSAVALDPLTLIERLAAGTQLARLISRSCRGHRWCTGSRRWVGAGETTRALSEALGRNPSELSTQRNGRCTSRWASPNRPFCKTPTKNSFFSS